MSEDTPNKTSDNALEDIQTDEARLRTQWHPAAVLAFRAEL